MAKSLYLILLLGVLAQAQTGNLPQFRSTGTTPLKLSQGMTVESLAGRADTDEVELSNGKRVTVGTLRRLDAAAKKIQAAKSMASKPSALRARPAATGFRVNNRVELLAALDTRSDNQTLQLPSGRTVTVGQLRLIRPYVEKRTRFGLASAQPSTVAPAFKITAASTDKAFWKEVLETSGNDSKVLESPHGKRITVGELKEYMAQSPRLKRGAGLTMPSAQPSKRRAR